MSYILDALRRADAERERDPGRGIHAQPVALPAEAGRRFPVWVVVAASALVLLVAGALLLRPSPRVAQELRMPPPNSPMLRQGPMGPPVRPVAAEVTPPPAVAVAPPPAVVAKPVIAAPAVAERPQERPVAQPAVAATPKAAAPVVAAPAVAVAPAAPPVPAPPAPAVAGVATQAPAAERVLAVAELPAELQRELPKLQISGGVHSDNASQRMLIVGGQVVMEGAEAAPGVVVEQIRAKSAVLKFRGYRYSVQY
jgi:general secretion pathway protein B